MRDAMTQRLKNAILPVEGVDALIRVVGAGLPQVVVSTVTPAFLRRAVTATGGSDGQHVPSSELHGGVPKITHPRAHLATTFAAPRDEVEEMIATLWQEMLGISPIGVDDDFFELGGDSLIAVQLMFRLSAGLSVELTTQMLFDTSTVRRLAATVRQAKQSQEARAVEVAQVFAMVDGLSDEEVKRVLAEGGPGAVGAV
jgi:acyl carrier protein